MTKPAGPGSGEPITDLLRAWERGDTEALQDLMTVVYGKLHAQSRRALRGERPYHTLSPTALVNEVYLRLAGLQDVSWENRARFFAFAARLMRQVLVEYARARAAKKRWGGQKRVDLRLVDVPGYEDQIDFLDLNDALAQLEEQDPLLGKIVELRFFSGLTEDEIAEVLGKSRSYVQGQWTVAKLKLFDLLHGQPAAKGAPND